jgi:hypothetical protein
MLLLLAGYKFCSDDEYSYLKKKQSDLENQLEAIQQELINVNYSINIEKFYHEPHVILSIEKLPNGTRKWKGRVKVPEHLLFHFKIEDRKRLYLTFHVCPADEFAEKTDPVLIEKAKIKAQNTIKERFNRTSQ